MQVTKCFGDRTFLVPFKAVKVGELPSNMMKILPDVTGPVSKIDLSFQRRGHGIKKGVLGRSLRFGL